MPIDTSGTIVLTNEMLLAGMTGNGGWNCKQLAAFGVPCPPPAGWKQRLLGRRVQVTAYQQFLAAKARPKPKHLETPALFD